MKLSITEFIKEAIDLYNPDMSIKGTIIDIDKNQLCSIIESMEKFKDRSEVFGILREYTDSIQDEINYLKSLLNK